MPAKKKVRAAFRRKKVSTKKKKKVEANYHHNLHVTEQDLVGALNVELRDAWEKLRAFGESLGEQRIYASHKCIMFSKKVCYFFVRPKKSFIEVWFFLPCEVEGLKSTRAAKKIEKYANLFKLIHADQVEEPLTDWIREAYDFTPANA